MATTESTDEEHGPTTPLRLDRATLYAKPNESFPDIPFKPLGRRGTQANLSDVRRGTVRLAKSIIDSLPNENGDFSPSITDVSELDSFANKSYENARRRRFEALQDSPVYSSYKRRSFDKNKLYTIPAPAGFYAERGTKAAPPFVKNYDKDIEARELAKDEWRAYADSNPYYEAGSVALPDISDDAKQKEEYGSELRAWQQANPGYTEAALDAKRDELLKKYPRKDLTPTGLYGTSWHELMHMLTPNILRTNDSHIYSPFAGLGGDAGVENHGKDNKYYFSGLAEGAIPALSYKNMHGVLTGEDLSSEDTSEGIYSKIEPLFKAFLDEKNVGNNSELLQQLGITQWAELDKHYREAAESKDATPDDIKNYNEWKKYVNYMIWLSKNNKNAVGTTMETKTAAYRLGYNSFMSKRAGLVMPWEANRQEQAPASPKENVATAAKSVLTDMGYSFPQEQGEQPFGYSVSMTQPGSKPALAPYGANLQTRAGNLQKKWNTPGVKPQSVGAAKKTAELLNKLAAFDKTDYEHMKDTPAGIVDEIDPYNISPREEKMLGLNTKQPLGGVKAELAADLAAKFLSAPGIENRQQDVYYPRYDSESTSPAWEIGFGSRYDAEGNRVTAATRPMTHDDAVSLLSKNLQRVAKPRFDRMFAPDYLEVSKRLKDLEGKQDSESKAQAESYQRMLEGMDYEPVDRMSIPQMAAWLGLLYNQKEENVNKDTGYYKRLNKVDPDPMDQVIGEEIPRWNSPRNPEISTGLLKRNRGLVHLAGPGAVRYMDAAFEPSGPANLSRQRDTFNNPGFRRLEDELHRIILPHVFGQVGQQGQRYAGN